MCKKSKMIRSLKRLAEKTGQSVLEYSVVFVAIASAILLAIPMFMKPSMNRYYKSSADFIDGTANGIADMSANISSRFSRSWSDYAFDPADNKPINYPSFEDAISGMHDMGNGGGGGYTGGGATGGGATGGAPPI